VTAAVNGNPAPPPPAAISAAGIVKDFGFRRILDGISLEVGAGTFFTLFGPNGAGKTTLIRILSTVARPTEGTVRIGGEDVRGPGRSSARAKLGLISHRTLLYDHLTGIENLVFFANLYGVPGPRERAGALLRELQLWERRDDPAGTYSRGMQQRLAIARALVHDPEILFLDEPFTGLDPAAARLFASLLERLKDEKRTALLVTHDLGEGLRLGDRWGILAGGRIAETGESAATTPAGLAERYFAIAGGKESA
jgi:heme exporter protein A